MTERLRKILKGGKIDPKTADEAAVKYAIDNAGGGGGASLPAVTTDDNGKVLGVVGGAWNKADANFIINAKMSFDFSEGGEVEVGITDLDKSFAEICAAIDAHKNVILMADNGTPIEYVFVAVPGLRQADVVVLSGVTILPEGYARAVVEVSDNEGEAKARVDLYPIEPIDTVENGSNRAVTSSAVYNALQLVNPYIVHMTVDISGGTGTVTDGKTVENILAVAATNPNVYAEFGIGTGTYRIPLVGYDANTAQGKKTVTFSGVGTGAKGILIEGENDGSTDTFSVVMES